jgi:hypothetical protein
LGSGWQRQTCGESSPEPFDATLRGERSSVGLVVSSSSSVAASSRGANLFLVDRGGFEAGDGSSSSFVRCSGLDVGADLTSWILLLFRRFLECFASSIVEAEGEAPTCMLDLTYRRGTWKKVATGLGRGGDEGRVIGGSTRLANILNRIDELSHIIKVFEVRFHCPRCRKGATSDEPSSILSCFESDMREQIQMHCALTIRRERSSKLMFQTDAAWPLVVDFFVPATSQNSQEYVRDIPAFRRQLCKEPTMPDYYDSRGLGNLIFTKDLDPSSTRRSPRNYPE